MTKPSAPTVVIAREQLDHSLADLPNTPAVFLIHPREGDPYLAKTGMLRRRLLRLLRERERPSRMLSLRDTAVRVECWLTGSSLESMLVQYSLARRCFPGSYREHLRLRLPPYVKIVLSNAFPRSAITRRIAPDNALYYGPFQSRASAEAFEARFLDLFQMRRCQEDLLPAPDHPGCIYGEMSMCLRPCQQVVGPEEYRSEVDRVTQFLATGGRSLLTSIGAARERLSQELEFEEAARQHKRMERVEEVLKLRDELVCDADHLHGVAVTRSAVQAAVNLWFVHQGAWQPRIIFPLTEQRSLDERLRELISSLIPKPAPARRRMESLAILARWYYSSWRDGEWLPFESLNGISIRKLVRMVSRVGQATAPSPHRPD